MNALSETNCPGVTGGAFATTRWSLVMDAQAQSPATHDALEQLCRIYWRPIYSFLRREGRRQEDAQDLTQGFFAQLLERGDFAAIRREKGRLRSYLLGSLKHFLANDRRRAMSLKRGEGRGVISLGDLSSEEGAEFESEALSADRIYDRRWAVTVLDQVFTRLSNECRNLGHAGLSERLSELLSDEPGRPSQAEVAREFGDRRQNRWQDAVRDFKHALELDPRNAKILIDAGVTYSLMRAGASGRRLVRVSAKNPVSGRALISPTAFLRRDNLILKSCTSARSRFAIATDPMLAAGKAAERLRSRRAPRVQNRRQLLTDDPQTAHLSFP